MGRLAMAGALAGLGQGLVDTGKQRAEAEAEAAKTAHDDAREEAMVRLKAKLEGELRQGQYGHEEKLQEVRGSQAMEQLGAEGAQKKELLQTELGGKESLQGKEQTFKGSESEKQRQFEAVQEDKKMEAQKEVARITAAGKEGLAKKWDVRTKKSGGEFNPQTGQVTPITEVTTITSPYTGSTYEQNGNMFLPQDPKELAQVKMPDPDKMGAAMQWLQKDPKANAQKFLEFYHWLPGSMMKYVID